jgi:hypothetical protein
VTVRRLLWLLAFVLLLVAAVLAYSPNPARRRHLVPLALAGSSLFVLGWAVGGDADLDL